MKLKQTPLLDVLTTSMVVGSSLLLAVVAVQATLYRSDAEQAKRIAAQAVAQVEAIAGDSVLASRRAATTTEACSPVDLDKLRGIAFSSSHLSDVGRVKGDEIICTALWGTLPRPIALPAPGYSRPQIRIWRSDQVPQTTYQQTNLVVRGDVLTVSSPSAYDSLDPSHRATIVVLSRDGQHVFKMLRAHHERARKHASVVERDECSQRIEACAVVWLSRKTVWQLPILLLLGIGFTAAMAGLAISFWLLKRRHRPGSLDQRFEIALRRGLISLEYQPLCNADTGEIVGWEALSRWTTSSGEVISPDIFVPLAHIHGLSPALARYVVQRSLHELSSPLRAGITYVCVNVEPEDVADPDFPSFVSSAVAQQGIAPCQLKFEVTERTDIVHPGFLKNMQRMQAEGFCFLIDDFGTGNANFSHLAKTRFDGVKIDRLFTSALGTDSPLRSVLPAIYNLAITLGLDVTIEGVESFAQLEEIRQVAPEATVQGWHLGRPRPAEVLDSE